MEVSKVYTGAYSEFEENGNSLFIQARRRCSTEKKTRDDLRCNTCLSEKVEQLTKNKKWGERSRYNIFQRDLFLL